MKRPVRRDGRSESARQRRVTITDVARAAKVSLGTASRVVNARPNVDPALRTRVEEAIRRLGYLPDFAAQSLRGTRTRTIGVLIRDIGVPSFASLLSAAETALQGAGYAVLLACSEDVRERELRLLELFARRRVDGLIMTTCDESDRELIAARARLRLPVVLLDRDSELDNDALLIGHAEGLRQAVTHLIELGHRRIGLLTGSARVRAARERLEGYRHAFAAKRLRVDPRYVRAERFTGEAAFREASELLSLADPPTAIVAGGTALLPGVLAAARARGLRIPEELSVVASGDSDLAQLGTPSITVVRWSYGDLGRIGAELLLERIAGRQPSSPRRVIVPTELVVRESCGPSPRGGRRDRRRKSLPSWP